MKNILKWILISALFSIGWPISWYFNRDTTVWTFVGMLIVYVMIVHLNYWFLRWIWGSKSNTVSKK